MFNPLFTILSSSSSKKQPTPHPHPPPPISSSTRSEHTTRSGTNEQITILDEDSRTIGGGGGIGVDSSSKGSLVSRAIAKFNTNTDKNYNSNNNNNNSLAFRKSNSSSSIKRGQSLKIPANYTKKNVTESNSSSFGLKHKSIIPENMVETTSSSNYSQTLSTSKDYRNNFMKSRNTPIRSTSTAGTQSTSTASSGYSWKRKTTNTSNNSISVKSKHHANVVKNLKILISSWVVSFVWESRLMFYLNCSIQFYARPLSPFLFGIRRPFLFPICISYVQFRRQATNSLFVLAITERYIGRTWFLSYMCRSIMNMQSGCGWSKHQIWAKGLFECTAWVKAVEKQRVRVTSILKSI